MMRHECDRCGREIDSDSEVWYSVRVEAQAQATVRSAADEDDRDHLLEIQSELDAVEEVDGSLRPACDPLEATYDLCGECYEKYARSPVGAEPAALGFSRN